jgi:hypothetical protein
MEFKRLRYIASDRRVKLAAGALVAGFCVAGGKDLDGPRAEERVAACQRETT